MQGISDLDVRRLVRIHFLTLLIKMMYVFLEERLTAPGHMTTARPSLGPYPGNSTGRRCVPSYSVKVCTPNVLLFKLGEKPVRFVPLFYHFSILIHDLSLLTSPVPVIVILFIFAGLVIGVACFLSRKRSRVSTSTSQLL